MKIFLSFLKIILVDCRYFIAIGIRLFMIILSEILLQKYDIVYTDIDYHVFSDGAKHLLNFQSPYERETYRYTPILAFMMIPNHIINYNFGKVLLSIIDVLVGLLIEILLNIQNSNKKFNKEKQTINNREDNEISKTNKVSSSSNLNLFKFFYSYIDNPYAYTSLIYLYNPFTINICTRGSADCIITFLVILSLILIELGLFSLAGIIYGFAVHFKIYPIIYAPALYLYLISKNVSIRKILCEDIIIKSNQYDEVSPSNDNYPIIFTKIYFYYDLFLSFTSKLFIKIKQIIKIVLKSIFNFKAIIFALLTVATFSFFMGFFYLLYGNKFLYEYFLYHLVRKDHRHNYSIFYYLIYLTYSTNLSKLLSFLTFAPQVILIVLSTLFLFQSINLCLLVLTMVFVTFNKVITAQYFLWFICLIPLVAPHNKLLNSRKHGGRTIYCIFLFSIWLGIELYWNSFAHNLEYKGENLFLEMWLVNLIFFLVNCVMIKEFIVSHESIYA